MQPSLTNEQDLVEIVLDGTTDTITIGNTTYSDTWRDINNLKIFKNCTKVSVGEFVPTPGKKYFRPIYSLDINTNYKDFLFNDIINAVKYS
ncbi:MAG: hypothetical protein WC916_01450 [Candidatus Woesearchaeota archaeon]